MASRSAAPLLATAFLLLFAACGGSGAPTGAASPGGPGSTAAGDESAEPGDGGQPSGPATAEPGTTPASNGSSSAPADGTGVDNARLATGETPSGWVQVLSNDSACRQAVPPDWYTDVGIPGDALAVDNFASSRVVRDSAAKWSDYIDRLKATYFTDGQLTLLQTDRLFLMRNTVAGNHSRVMALHLDGYACGVIIPIDEAAGDTYDAIATQILYSIAATKR
ncbi:MAG: hypothetical protein HYX55_08145 [Chloroflexi bacterium]|nr:hypothetical protein [Chloroflexota bacterium]